MAKHPDCTDRDSHGPHTLPSGAKCGGYDTPQPKPPRR